MLVTEESKTQYYNETLRGEKIKSMTEEDIRKTELHMLKKKLRLEKEQRLKATSALEEVH